MNRIISAVALLLISGSSTAMAGDDVFVGQRVAGSKALEGVDHSSWDALLRKYVDENGLVNYHGWHSSRSDIEKLEGYLAILSAGDTAAASQDGKLAFWINAYNAVTIRGILREYPTTSIRNHTARFIGYNIWQDLKLYVGGKPYSLEGIEHDILRKMNEPRIHFGIVCASIGCPRLLNEAYAPSKVHQQLETNARDFFSHGKHFRYDVSGKRFYLSEIFSWFGTDFGADQAAQLKRIAKWLPTPAAQNAAEKNAVSVSFLEYDWGLNDRKPAAADGK